MLKKSRSGGKVTFPVIAYHGTGRLWAEHERQKENKEKQKIEYKKQGEGVAMAYLKCLSPKSSSKEFLSWYKTFEDEVRKFNQDSDKLLLQIFNECIVSMMPDNHWHDMAFSFRDDDLIGIFVTPDRKNEKLLFKQLSDGYRNIIGMAADIAYRCIKLNPHLGKTVMKETPGIVLIDELDLHLHPTWQKRIVDDFKKTFPKIQFIATTHSPFIIQSLKSDEVWNLDKIMDITPKQLNIDTIATKVMGVSSPFSTTNEAAYEESKDFLTNLNAGRSNEELNNDLNQISDPAVRAFLELAKMSKGK